MITTAHKNQLALTERDLVMRRFDIGARISLLAAGLAAQGAMWVAAPSRVYLVGAVLLIAVSADAARRPLARFVASPVASRRFTDRQVMAGRVVAGVVFVEICMGVVGALHVADSHAMGTPLGALLLAVQIAYAGAVESRRDLKLCCAIVVALLVQAGAFTTTGTVRLPIVASLVLLMVAVALLQRASALELVDSITLPGRAPLLRSFVGPVAGATMLGVVAFLVVPNSLDLGIVTRVRTPSAHAADSGPPTGVGTRAAVDAGASTLDLRVRGALPTAPVFVVAATTPAYWQGAVFDHFDGTSWTSTSSAASAAAASSNVADGSASAIAPRRTDVVDVVSIVPLDVVLAPGTVTEYSGTGQVRTDSFGTTRLSIGPANGDRYQVTSMSADGASASQLRAAGGAFGDRAAVGATNASAAGDAVSPLWLQVPAELPARVHTLAVSIAGAAPTRYDAVTAIDTYLQTHEIYDLDSPRPAAGVDAVDDFLFVNGRGFCEQFASAAVVMLRSLGIPARLVTGFVQGDVSSFPGQRVMRGSDAHAWIQVWYPGVGWVSSDPTAGSVATGAPPVPAAVPAATATAATVSAAATASPPTPAAIASAPTPAQVPPSVSAMPSAVAVPSVRAAAAPKPAASPARHAHATNLPGGRVRWLEALAALGLLAGLVTRLSGRALRRRRRRLAAGTGRPTDGPVLTAYLRLDAALASRDQARAPGETVAEAEERLRLASAAIDRGGRLAASADEIAGAVRCLERECYGVDRPPRDQVLAAVAVLDRLSQRPQRPPRRQKPPDPSR